MNATELRCILSWPFGHKWKREVRRDPTTSTYEEITLLVCTRCGKQSELGASEAGGYLDDLGDLDE
jgi:hypothetical protein